MTVKPGTSAQAGNVSAHARPRNENDIAIEMTGGARPRSPPRKGGASPTESERFLALEAKVSRHEEELRELRALVVDHSEDRPRGAYVSL